MPGIGFIDEIDADELGRQTASRRAKVTSAPPAKGCGRDSLHDQVSGMAR
jgi:hypothetical protein